MREEAWSVLEALAREGARKLLQQALENEVAEYIEAHAAKRDVNVLDKLPKGLQGKAKSMIHEMYMAETKENALKEYRHFVDVYSDKFPRRWNA